MKHACPHDGYADNNGYTATRCGFEGRLCDMCREDRADDRAVEASIIQGLLANRPHGASPHDILKIVREAQSAAAADRAVQWERRKRG